MVDHITTSTWLNADSSIHYKSVRELLTHILSFQSQFIKSKLSHSSLNRKWQVISAKCNLARAMPKHSSPVRWALTSRILKVASLDQVDTTQNCSTSSVRLRYTSESQFAAYCGKTSREGLKFHLITNPKKSIYISSTAGPEFVVTGDEGGIEIGSPELEDKV